MTEFEKKILDKIEHIAAQNRELKYTNIFHDTIKGSTWLPAGASFSLGRGAMNYSAMYVLYRVLDEMRPQSILELGMGQSTKMISHYSRNNKGIMHRVIEHDESFISFFEHHYDVPDSTEIVRLEIVDEELDIGNQKSNVTHYVDFDTSLLDRKYDLLVVDGPYGYRSPVYSRVDTLSILNRKRLKEDFVIIMHDYHRQGEKNTVEQMKSILEEKSIKYSFTVYNDVTAVIVSKKYNFFCSM